MRTEIQNFFFTYPTNVSIELNNKCSAIIYRVGQVFLIILISYWICKNSSWNKYETGVSSVYNNVEGVDYLKNGSIYDAIDFVRPAQERGAFFIATKIMVTQQMQGVCTDYDQDGRNNCTRNEDCVAERKAMQGINTGNCDLSKRMCQVKGWCPVQDFNSTKTITSLLSNVDNFTVYVRNNVEFFSLNNSGHNYNFTIFPAPCLYDAVKSPKCPIFRIKDILKSMNVSYASVREEGAVFGFIIFWECYFNWNIEPCKIRYEFERLAKDKAGEFVGYKYKYADYHVINETKIRTRTTAYGLRFLILVSCRGYQFDWYTLATSIGSFLSYFSILTMVSYLIFYNVCFTDRQKRLHLLDDIQLEEKTSVPI